MQHEFLFYAPELNPGDADVTLTGEEHRHLTRVLRFSVGDETSVTNGRGLIVRARITDIERDATKLSVESTLRDDVDFPHVCLALALIKKDRFEQAVEQCVELGATAFRPFVAERSHLREVGDGFVERLQRIAVSAMKQSLHSILPEIHAPMTFPDLVAATESYGTIIAGDQDTGTPLPAAAGSTLVIVGPEAGFTAAEQVALTSAGTVFAAISPYRLRSETAAAALVAAVCARR